MSERKGRLGWQEGTKVYLGWTAQRLGGERVEEAVEAGCYEEGCREIGLYLDGGLMVKEGFIDLFILDGYIKAS